MAKTFRRRSNSKLTNFFYTSLIGGLTVLLPIYLTLFFVNAIVNNILRFFKPLMSGFSVFFPFLEHEIARKAFAVILLILLCFVGGVISRTALGSMVQKAVKPGLEKLPGYHLLQSVTHQITDSGAKDLKVAIVALGELDQALSVGFLIAQHKNGDYAVFIPSVPAPAAGAMYIVPENKVLSVDVSFLTAIKFYSQFGEGSDELLEALSQCRLAQPQPPDNTA
jgi:uncharacterized membrane protein